MSKKSEKKLSKLNEGICPYCTYNCHDTESLKKHVDWVHKTERVDWVHKTEKVS